MNRFSLHILRSRKGELPFHPQVAIYVSKYTRDKDGRIFVIPKCITPQEVDHWIDESVTNLERLRKRAKSALRTRK